jgi:hypothetical protein
MNLHITGTITFSKRLRLRGRLIDIVVGIMLLMGPGCVALDRSMRIDRIPIHRPVQAPAQGKRPRSHRSPQFRQAAKDAGTGKSAARGKHPASAQARSSRPLVTSQPQRSHLASCRHA